MENPSYFLENVVKEKDELVNFEGPLSLILMLLAKDKIEIRDLKIAEILDQYLAYIEQMKEMDLEIASEFVQMASHLLYIKTKTLLAGDKEVSELEALLESLEQLKAGEVSIQIKGVVPQLKTAAETGMYYYEKLPEPLPKQDTEYTYEHTASELLAALLNIYSTPHAVPDLSAMQLAIPHRIIYSIRTKSQQLLECLKKGAVPLEKLYSSCGSRSELIATFVSVLELCSGGIVSLISDGENLLVNLMNAEAEEVLEKIDYQ